MEFAVILHPSFKDLNLTPDQVDPVFNFIHDFECPRIILLASKQFHPKIPKILKEYAIC